MSLHSFDPKIAKKVGLNAAVIYQNIVFWTAKNLANDKHCHDGCVWTYNSVRAWTDLFPYLTENQIRTALAKLVDAGLVVEGNYNKIRADRTKWYGVLIELHLGKNTNAFGKKPEPIPDSKPDSKHTTLQGAGAPDPDVQNLSERLCEAAGITDETKTPGLLVLSEPLNWLENGCDLEEDVLPFLNTQKSKAGRVRSWSYYRQGVFEYRATRLAPPPDVKAKPRYAKKETTAERVKRIAERMNIND